MTDDAAINRSKSGSGGGDPVDARSAPFANHLSVEAMSAYLDDQLSRSERQAADLHLRDCAVCRRDLGDLRASVMLLGQMPVYRPRRSFQIQPEQSATTTGAGSWMSRLLPSLPALRAATVAVALLLMGVIVGDVVTNTAPTEERPPARIAAPPTAADPDRDDEQDAAAPASTERPEQTTIQQAPAESTLPAPTAPPPAAESANEAGESQPPLPAAAPPRTTAPAALPEDGERAAGPAPASDTVSEESEAAFAEADEATEDEPMAANGAAAGSRESALAAVTSTATATATATATPSPTATATAPPTATPSPTATATAPPTATPSPSPMPTATPAPTPSPTAAPEPSSDGASRPSTWRIAEIALAILLAWLIVSLIGLKRMRR